MPKRLIELSSRTFAVCYCRIGLATLAVIACLWASVAPGQPLGPLQHAIQEDTEQGPAIGADQLEALVKTLEDPAERDRLVTQLRALIAASNEEAQPSSPQSVGVSLAASLAARLDDVFDSTADLATAIVDLPDLWTWLVQQAVVPTARLYWYEVLSKSAAVLLLGALAYWIAGRSVRSFRARLRAAPREASFATRARALVGCFVLDLLALAAFALVGGAALYVLDPRSETKDVVASVIAATVAVLAVLAATRVALAPKAPGLRFLDIQQHRAVHLDRWVRRFACVVIYSYMLLRSDLLLGVPSGIANGLKHALGLLVACMTVIFIFQIRGAIAGWLRGGPDEEDRAADGAVDSARRFLADIWHLLASAYVIATYLIWVLRVPGGFELLLRGTIVTTVLIGVARPLAQIAQRMTAEAAAASAEDRARPLRARFNWYVEKLNRVSTVVLYVAIGLVILWAWGLNLVDLARGNLEDRVLGGFVSIAVVLLVSVIVWEAFDLMIGHYLEATGEAGTRVERSGRMRTLLPLLRTVLLVLIGIVFLFHAMSVFGVDLTPLLATAGVIGIAIGFGSQKLVQDVINGLFILFQDTIDVGDVVNVGGHQGVVERISIRTIELRDLQGIVHTVPFSEVTTIQNWSKTFAFALLDVGVAYREDVDEVIEVLRQIGAELEADPKFAESILEPIDVMGLDSFADSAVIIRARIKTAPLKQWPIKREFNLRLKRRFDELGIEIPFPHQTVYFGQDKAERAPPVHVRLDRRAAEVASLRVIDTPEAPSSGGKP